MKRVLFCTLAALVVGCVNIDETTNVTVEKAKDKTVMENIMTRRSIRDYKPEAVNREQMARVIECGIYAPNAMNKQTWAVRVVDAPDFIEGVTNIAVEQNPQLKTIYIHPEAPINTISCDEHVEVYLYDAEEHNDVNSGNWGDEDVNPWANAA